MKSHDILLLILTALSFATLIMACAIDLADRATARSGAPVAEAYTPPADTGPTCEPDDWNLFIDALISIESAGQADAVGDGGNAVGILQIHPRTVEECNRIIGREFFTLEDRLSPSSSRLMFNVIQSHHNPDRDKHLALKCWNPRAPIDYHRKVMRKLEELKNQ